MEGQTSEYTEGGAEPLELENPAEEQAEAEEPEEKGPTDAEAMDACKRLFPIAVDYWRENYDLGRKDVKFGRLSDQWPDHIKKARDGDKRPVQTTNLVAKIPRQIVNDWRKNRVSIKVNPVDDVSDPKTAEAEQGMVRAIEAESRASVAYDTALEHAADRSIGYVRVVTEYKNRRSDEQVIRIKRVRNPFAVFIDPNAQEPDASDAENAFVATGYVLDAFKLKFPGAKLDGFDLGAVPEAMKHWMRIEDSGGKSQMTIFVVEFYWVYCRYEGIGDARREHRSVWWFKCTANEVLERTRVAGDYIPISRFLGEEIDLDGMLHTKSCYRDAFDAQRGYNYNDATNTEGLGLSVRPHWLGTVKKFGQFLEDWKNSHLKSTGVLLHEHDPQDPGPPKRSDQISPNTAALSGMETKKRDIYDVTGIYPPDFGQPGTQERSGAALRQRETMGKGQTFHYHDNACLAISHVGRIILGMIPAVYDTERVVRILGADGKPGFMRLNPNKADTKPGVYRTTDGREFPVYNLNQGEYDVTVSTGPSYDTQRQEGAAAMVEIYQATDEVSKRVMLPELLRKMDWPGAEELADTMELLIPSEIANAKKTLGETDPKRQILQLTQQLQQVTQMVQTMQPQMQQMAALLGEKQTATQLEVMKIQAGREKEALEAKSSIESARMYSLPEIMDILLKHGVGAGAMAGAPAEAAAPAPMEAATPPIEPEPPEAAPGEE